MPQSRKAITNRAFCVRRCIGLNFVQWCAVESTKLQKHTEAHTHTHIRSNQPHHLNRKYESNPVYHCKSFFCACPQCPAFHIDNRSSVVLISNIQACVFMWMCAIVYDAMQCTRSSCSSVYGQWTRCLVHSFMLTKSITTTTPVFSYSIC